MPPRPPRTKSNPSRRKSRKFSRKLKKKCFHLAVGIKLIKLSFCNFKISKPIWFWGRHRQWWHHWRPGVRKIPHIASQMMQCKNIQRSNLYFVHQICTIIITNLRTRKTNHYKFTTLNFLNPKFSIQRLPVEVQWTFSKIPLELRAHMNFSCSQKSNVHYNIRSNHQNL